MLCKISEISGNRYREAKQSYLAVCLSSKFGEKWIHNPTSLRPTNGQYADGIRRPTADDRLFMTRAGLSAILSSFGKEEAVNFVPRNA